MCATIACQYTVGTSRRGDIALRSRSPRKCHYALFAYPLFKRAQQVQMIFYALFLINSLGRECLSKVSHTVPRCEAVELLWVPLWKPRKEGKSKLIKRESACLSIVWSDRPCCQSAVLFLTWLKDQAQETQTKQYSDTVFDPHGKGLNEFHEHLIASRLASMIREP